MIETKNDVASYLENVSLVLLGILFFAFPLLFTTLTTDPFTLPKQILLAAVSLIALFLLGASFITKRKVQLRRTPFDLGVFLFGLCVFLSTLFSVNRYDSLIAFIPVLFAILSYFIIVNTVKNEASVTFLLLSLVCGASFVSMLSILSYFKLYILPFSFTHSQSFSPFGSLLDQALYLGTVLCITGGYFFFRLQKKEQTGFKKEEIVFAVLFGTNIIGFLITAYQLVTLPPLQGGFLVLPFATGYQTTFAAISQDSGRIVQGLLFGSGFGTYAVDFGKYKLPNFNLNQTLWSLTFFRSSSFLLEILATTGILGLLSFLHLIVKVIKIDDFLQKLNRNAAFSSFLFLCIAAFLLPFSFALIALLFFVLSLFAAIEGLQTEFGKSRHYFDIELRFIAAKNSVIPLSVSPVESIPFHKVSVQEEMPLTKFLPISLFVFFALFGGIVGFFAVRFVASDVLFQTSLVAASNNNGLQTYKNQVSATNIFPYRDIYYRVYSQTNLAIANSLAAAEKGATPSAQTQQTIYTLIQQSINAGRTATSLSPQTALNWQNLSSIYRSLIGFGQNADNFAIISAQQAVILDSNNPQAYVNLGGIYYQLGQWEKAQNQFQIAINLKPDFANAYYNLGHTLENKGDLQNALGQYQTVKTLVSANPDGLKKINAEITDLQNKIGKDNATAKAKSAQQVAGETTVRTNNQLPLKVSSSAATLPPQNPQVQIPAPASSSAH